MPEGTVQFAVLAPAEMQDELTTRYVLGKVVRQRRQVDSDGIMVRGGRLDVEVKRGAVAFGEVIRYQGQHFRVDGVQPRPPFFVTDRVLCTLRAAGADHDGRTLVDRRLDDRLTLLRTVQLYRRGTTRSTVTGQRTFLAPVDVKAKIEAHDSLDVDADKSVVDAKHKVRVYGERVEVSDVLEWDGERHTVRMVDGLLKDADGARYATVVTVN